MFVDLERIIVKNWMITSQLKYINKEEQVSAMTINKSFFNLKQEKVLRLKTHKKHNISRTHFKP